MIRILLVILLSSISLNLISCGPEKSSDELRDDLTEDQDETRTKIEKEKLERIAEDRRANIEKIDGVFKGVYTGPEGKITVRVELNYVEVETFIPNTRQSVFMPEIRGVVVYKFGTTLSLTVFGANDNASTIVLRSGDGRHGMDLRLKSDSNMAGRFFSPQFDSKIDLTRE